MDTSPSITISEDIKSRIDEYSRRIARSLNVRGPFNIQYLVKNGEVFVIECNLHASRSMPFVLKTADTNLMDLAVDALLGKKIPYTKANVSRYGVKSPNFLS